MHTIVIRSIEKTDIQGVPMALSIRFIQVVTTDLERIMGYPVLEVSV